MPLWNESLRGKEGEAMKQKNATPTAAQKEILKRFGLAPFCWVVVKDLKNVMIIKNRITGEFRMIEKGGRP